MRWLKSPSGKPACRRSMGRRSAARSISAAAFLALVVCAVSPARAAPIRHGVADIQLYGVQAIAAHARRVLPGLLARALADFPIEGHPPGTRLVLRVNEVFLSSDPGSDFGSLGSSDSLSGEVVLTNARGATILRRPVVVHVRASGASILVTPGSEERRVQNLLEAIAEAAVRTFR